MYKKCELDLFPTPVSLYDLSELDVNPLLEAIEDAETHYFHLVDGGESTFAPTARLFEDERCEVVACAIQDCLNDYCHRTGLYPLKIQESWFNKTPPGGRLELHRHEGSAISGAFYPLGGNVTQLQFKSPTHPYKMNDLYRNDANTPYSYGYQGLQSDKGMLVLFPSWLEHKTEKEIGDRLVVSFNSFYNPDGCYTAGYQ